MKDPLDCRPAAILFRLMGVALLLLAVAAPAVASAPRGGATDPAEKAAIAELLSRMDRAQQSMRSFTAELVETRSLALLSEDEVLTGRITFEKPGRFRWEYVSPEARTYVLVDGVLTGWMPSENRAERLDLGRHKKRAQRLIALGQSEESLRREFRIRAIFNEDGSAVDHLVLVPRSRRVRKKMVRLELWIDEQTGLARKILYATDTNDQDEVVFKGLVVNPDLGEEIFTLDLPPDCQVVDGESSFGFGAK